ncbi:MAG: hypothetical protein ABIH89_07805 [Elusimicrobiota bacterium]
MGGVRRDNDTVLNSVSSGIRKISIEINLDISVLRLKVAIESADEDFAAALKIRYSRFTVDSFGSDYHPVRLKLEAGSGYSGSISTKETRTGWNITGRGIDVEHSDSSTCGSIFPDIHILDSLFRIICSRLLVAKGGILIHAAGIEGDVYTGPAGSGKTTSVRDRDDMLGDDIIALKKEKGGWYIYSTPFTGEFEGRVMKRNEKLERLYLLSMPEGKLGKTELMRGILKNTLYFFSDKDSHERLMEYSEDLASGIPGYGALKEHLKRVI